MLTPEQAFAKFRLSKDGAEALELVNSGVMTLPKDENDAPDVIIGGVWPAVIRGSRRANCAHCRKYVGLAPESGAACADRFPHVPVLCFVCARTQALKAAKEKK